jgi:hypothetical protein
LTIWLPASSSRQFRARAIQKTKEIKKVNSL